MKHRLYTSLSKAMSSPEDRVNEGSSHDIRSYSRSEQLVGFGFRCWLAGYKSKDIRFWNKGWERYASELGVCRARNVVKELGYWVQTVQSCSRRDLTHSDIYCPDFCKDECLAIALIAASQHKSCPALQACAVALLESDDCEPVLKSSDSFAYALSSADITLKNDMVSKLHV